MAVLVEAFSVVVPIDTITVKLKGGLDCFLRLVPNKTLCTDGLLARVGFMHPDDVRGFISRLEEFGLTFSDGETSVDLAVVDQLRGSTLLVPWLEIGRLQVGRDEVSAAWRRGEAPGTVAVPEGWKFAGSISQEALHAMRPDLEGKPLIGRDGQSELHLDLPTGKPLYVGRTTGPSPEQLLYQRLRDIQRETLDLADEADQVRAASRSDSAARIFLRLQDGLLPEAEAIAAGAGANMAFAHYAVGLILRVLERFDQAVEPLLRARELQPGVANTLLELVLCLGQLGRDDESLPYAREAAELEPDSPATLGNLAMCLLQVGEKEEARRVLDKALAVDPGDKLNRYIDANFDRYN